jgi:sodium-dependent dicarboxylate transporter 2/3/5
LSGAGEVIAEIMTEHHLKGGLVSVALFVLSGMVLSNISSNTAACAILTPIVISVMQAQGVNPVPYVYITLTAANCAYVLPTSVRAIPVAYGLDPKVMFRKGLWAVLISFVVVTLAGYAFARYWPGFSVA